MRKLILQVLGGILGIWLAVKFIPKVEFSGSIQILFLIGIILGLINFFIKPVLKILTLPLRILTLGLFSLIINIGIIWVVDVLFAELIIPGIFPLLWTTIIIGGIEIVLSSLFPKKKK